MTPASPRSAESSSGLAPDDPSFDISDEADVRALLRAEEGHFWHRSRNRFIRKQLQALGLDPPARILELGCGAGCVAAELARAGYDVTGVDGHRSLIDVAMTRAPRARFFCSDLRKGGAVPAAETFDAVCLFDVVEHLDDPEDMLARASRWAKPGGWVVGTVPALMALWSPIDEHAGHKTRYSARTLRAVLARAGAEVHEIAPFFRALVPMIWLQRRLIGKRGGTLASVENLRIPPRPVNVALAAALTLEQALAPVLARVPLPDASLWFALRSRG